MAEQINGFDLEEYISRIHRTGTQAESSFVNATGTIPPAWVIRVSSHHSYNVYYVQLTKISQPGNPPSPVAGDIQAYNIAESFTGSGSLPAGTYAVMWRVGDKNVFYVKP